MGDGSAAFRTGPKIGVGRPTGDAARYQRAMRDAIREYMTFYKWMPIVYAAEQQAREGNKDARNWLAAYTIGPATSDTLLPAASSGQPVRVTVEYTSGQASEAAESQGDTT